MKPIILYASFICLAAGLFSTLQIKPQKEHFSIGEATEFDKLEQLHQKMMLEDLATGQIPNRIRQQELQYYANYIAPFQAKETRGSGWTSVGPWTVGGRTRAVAMDITNENIIIAGSVSGGIYRSTNAGQSWQNVSNLAGYQGVTSLAQDKRAGKQNIWYASTGEGAGNSAGSYGAYFFGDGIFKSIDSGKSWQPITSTSSGLPNLFSTSFQINWRIVTHPSVDSDVVLSANYGSIMRSADGGNTWKECLGSFSGNSAYYTDICVTSSGILYAALSSDGVGAGFWRSENKGISWTNITPANFTSIDRTVMGINPNNENQVYFFSYLPDSTNTYGTKTSNYRGDAEYISLMKYTYLTGDGAGVNGNWQNLSANLPNNANVSTGSFDKLNCQGGYDMFVKVQPTTGSIFIGGTNIFRSTDSFTTPNNFTQIGGYKQGTSLPHFEIWPTHHPDNHDLLFFPSDYKKILSASDGGIRITLNGNSASQVQWINSNAGYVTSQLYSVTLDPTANSKYLLAGFQDNGNFITSNYLNPSQQWVLPFNGDGAHNYIAPNREFYVMSIQEGKVAKFNLDNAGQATGFSRIDPIGPTKDDYTFINPLKGDPNNKDILYLPAGKKLYRQTQLSTLPLNGNWDSISTGWQLLTDTIIAPNYSTSLAAQITCIAVSKNPANTVYIGTSVNDVYRINNAHTGNPSFVRINKSFMSGYVSDISIDPDNDKKVMVCYSNYGINSVYYSQSAGDTFKFIRGNLRTPTANYSGVAPSYRAVCIAKLPNGKRRYFVGTSVGLYSTDSLRPGTTVSKDSTVWAQEGATSIGTNVVTFLDYRQEDGVLAVATHGAGAFYARLFFPTAIAPSPVLPANACLQVYPNPASTNVSIELQMPSSQTITVSMMDMNGKVLINKINTVAMAGKHTFVQDVSSLANGTYTIIVTTNEGKKLVQKIVVKK
jgi:hypothetical protein